MSQVIETRLGRHIRDAQEQVRQEGIANEHRLLRRQANSRFDTKTAERLALLLACFYDPRHLEDLGDTITHGLTEIHSFDQFEELMEQKLNLARVDYFRRYFFGRDLARGFDHHTPQTAHPTPPPNQALPS